MWKNFLKTILFLLVFVLLLLVISPVFLPKNNSYEAGIHEEEAKGFLAEPENTIDVLFVGDSETFSAFVPLRIWQQHGITSYVCSTGNQVMYQSYSYLERLLQTQNPKIVILETNALYREYTLADILTHWAEERLPFLRYHDRWKTITPEDWNTPVEFRNIVRDKGYIYRTRAIAADATGHMTPSEEVEPVPMISGLYVEKMQALCQEQGIQLILVSTPSPTNWNIYYHNGVKILTQELGIPYMDMNLMEEEIPIDWQTDTYDGGDHLNYFGACKVTDYMGKYLADSGLFADKREEAVFAGWNDNLAEFIEETEKEA